MPAHPPRETRTHIPRRGEVATPAPQPGVTEEMIAAAPDGPDAPIRVDPQEHRLRPTDRDVRVMLEERRRSLRDNSSITKFGQMNLQVIPAESLDLANWVYRWVMDTGPRIQMLTQMDTYVFVEPHEIKGTIVRQLPGMESSERVRILGGTSQHGQPVYHYLLKKPRDFWVEDYEEVVSDRDDLIHARVREGRVDEDEPNELGRDSGRYIPDHIQPQVAHAAKNVRRGFVGRSFKVE